MAAIQPQSDRAGVLFVDLDGTLIATDVLCESLLLAIKRQPSLLLRFPLWLLQGRAVLKRELSQRVAPDPKSLPYRESVLELIREQHQHGTPVVLATATDEMWARQVAAHVGEFDAVLASDGERNLKGRTKLAAIEQYCREQGHDGFAYVGDAHADLPIWREARQVYAVAPSGSLLRSIRAFCEPTQLAGGRRGPWRAALKALRPQQWVKNFLLLVPLLLAHQIGNPQAVLATCLAFVAFSACASSVYVLNDLLDIEADRQHPHKKRRPLAAGELPIQWAPPLVIGLLALGLGVAATCVSGRFAWIVLFYLAMTTLYSMWLKTKVMADVLVLAGLYTLRIVAGGTATGVPVSEWLMAFAMFLFTSLAFAKRYAELRRLTGEGDSVARGRGYLVGDLGLIASLGSTSGYLAVLVLALYINSGASQVQHLYANVTYLWLVCPLLMYWVSRLWLMAERGQLPEDPVVFAIKDRVSWIVGVLAALLVIAATFVP